MTATVNDFLTGFGVGGALKHAEPTMQDVIDGLTPAQRDAMDTVVAAALEDTSLAGNPEVVADFMTLPDAAMFYTAMVVGFLLEKEDDVEHSLMDRVGDFLEHFGVKGMKWGVIRDQVTGASSRSGGADGAVPLSRSSKNTAGNRQIARGKVKSGTATLEQAHLAALKSKGHRLLNAVSGDKTFWTRMAITAGITTAVVATSIAVPALAPASWMAALGVKVAAADGAAVVAGHVFVEGSGLVSTTMLGQGAFAAAGLTTATATAAIGTVGNVVGNTVRAVTGNTRVNNSYARLGAAVKKRQTAGSNRVNKILSKSGSVNKKDLRHDDISFGEMLHALESGSGGLVKKGAPKGDGKGGGRKFDESKVKRDGDGQFSRQASLKRPDDDVRTPEQIDASWKANVGRDKKLADALWSPKAPIATKMDAKVAEIKKRTGVDLAAQKMSVRETKDPKVIKAANELMSYIATETNRFLMTQPAAVSPSGTSRVQLRVINAGTGQVDFKYVFVPNKLKHSITDVTSLLHSVDEEGGGVLGGVDELLKLLGLGGVDADEN